MSHFSSSPFGDLSTILFTMANPVLAVMTGDLAMWTDRGLLWPANLFFLLNTPVCGQKHENTCLSLSFEWQLFSALAHVHDGFMSLCVFIEIWAVFTGFNKHPCTYFMFPKQVFQMLVGFPLLKLRQHHTLRTESSHDANFVVTGSTDGCRCDNRRPPVTPNWHPSSIVHVEAESRPDICLSRLCVRKSYLNEHRKGKTSTGGSDNCEALSIMHHGYSRVFHCTVINYLLHWDEQTYMLSRTAHWGTGCLRREPD